MHTVVLNDTELSSVDFSVTFLDGSSDQTRCTPIPIRNDMVLEGDHAFTVAIVGAGTPPHAVVGSPSSTTVTIKDDESRSFLLVTKYTENICEFIL